ncbi:type IX secretion system protein PorG [Parapedobacter soli]|uniref:type IX secretion system protein PorG n=1 Tax=Parapedobacter soli TaxID=416955 RepID=UPI0021C654D0|nr:porin family protein [Parapedobacter soli]
MLKAITSVCFFFLLSVANGQEWELGLQGGASGYMGDINPENPFAFNDWSVGALVKYNLNHTWGIRGNFAYANTYAYDGHSRVQQRRDRNLGFFGPIMEAALLVDFNFFKWLPQRGRIVYTPYIFAGVGGIVFEPKWYDLLDPATPEINLRDYRTEGVVYDNKAITIPFGAGFKYNLRGPWSVGVELGYRLVLTDYLDDVSKRGDGRPYDSFMTVGITLSYTIFKGGCPEWQ